MSIFDWLRRGSTQPDAASIDVSTLDTKELAETCAELQIRRLAMAVCANMTANVFSRAVFRTYENGKEVQGEDFHLWNIQPNPNESGSLFWRKVIVKLLRSNEALLVQGNGSQDSIWLADSFTLAPKTTPFAHNVWQGITINNKPVGPVRSGQTIHLQLNAFDITAPLMAVTAAQNHLVAKIQKKLSYQQGHHLKVHIDRIAQGDDDFSNKYAKVLQNQVKPFFDADNAVLPEFEGWTYQPFDEDKNSKIDDIGQEIRKMHDDIFDFTAKAFLIPPVLIFGEVADSKDAIDRWLTVAIDPLAKNIADEINRQFYTIEQWQKGYYLRIDTSCLRHLDIFGNANDVAKLVGSGWSYNDIQRLVGGTEIDADWANEHFVTKNNANMSTGEGR